MAGVETTDPSHFNEFGRFQAIFVCHGLTYSEWSESVDRETRTVKRAPEAFK